MKEKREAAIRCKKYLKIYYENDFIDDDDVQMDESDITEDEFDLNSTNNDDNDIYVSDSIDTSLKFDLMNLINADTSVFSYHANYTRKLLTRISSAAFLLRNKTYDQTSGPSLMKSFYIKYLSIFTKLSQNLYWANKAIIGLADNSPLKCAFSQALLPQCDIFENHFMEEQVLAGLTKINVVISNNSVMNHKRLNALHSLSVPNTVTNQHGVFINAGSYIKKMCWSPIHPDLKKEQFLAVAVYQSLTERANHIYNANNDYNMVQLYRFSLLTMSTSSVSSPEFHAAIIHDWGKITDMCWSPQPFPVVTQSCPLIGHLALVCGDGFVRILPIVRRTTPSQMIKIMPTCSILCLGPSKTVLDTGIFPTCIDWCQQYPDRLAVGYNSGLIALYVLESDLLPETSSVSDYKVHIQPISCRKVFDNAILSLRISPNNWRFVAATTALSSHAIVVDLSRPLIDQKPFNVDTLGISGANLLWPDPGDVIGLIGGHHQNGTSGIFIVAAHNPAKRCRKISIPDISVAALNPAFNVASVGTRSGQLSILSLNSSDIKQLLYTSSIEFKGPSESSIKRKFYHQYKLIPIPSISSCPDQQSKKSQCNCPSVLYCVHRLMSEFAVFVSKDEDKTPINWQLQSMVNINEIAVNPNPVACTWLALSLQCGLIHLVPLTHFYNTTFDQLAGGTGNKNLEKVSKNLLDTNLLPLRLFFNRTCGRPRKFLKIKKSSLMQLISKRRKRKPALIYRRKKKQFNNIVALRARSTSITQANNKDLVLVSPPTRKLQSPTRRSTRITNIFASADHVSEITNINSSCHLKIPGSIDFTKNIRSINVEKPDCSMDINFIVSQPVAANESSLNVINNVKSSVHSIKSRSSRCNAAKLVVYKKESQSNVISKVVDARKKRTSTSSHKRNLRKRHKGDVSDMRCRSLSATNMYPLKVNKNDISIDTDRKRISRISRTPPMIDDNKNKRHYQSSLNVATTKRNIRKSINSPGYEMCAGTITKKIIEQFTSNQDRKKQILPKLLKTNDSQKKYRSISVDGKSLQKIVNKELQKQTPRKKEVYINTLSQGDTGKRITRSSMAFLETETKVTISNHGDDINNGRMINKQQLRVIKTGDLKKKGRSISVDVKSLPKAIISDESSNRNKEPLQQGSSSKIVNRVERTIRGAIILSAIEGNVPISKEQCCRMFNHKDVENNDSKNDKIIKRNNSRSLSADQKYRSKSIHNVERRRGLSLDKIAAIYNRSPKDNVKRKVRGTITLSAKESNIKTPKPDIKDDNIRKKSKMNNGRKKDSPIMTGNKSRSKEADNIFIPRASRSSLSSLVNARKTDIPIMDNAVISNWNSSIPSTRKMDLSDTNTKKQLKLSKEKVSRTKIRSSLNIPDVSTQKMTKHDNAVDGNIQRQTRSSKHISFQELIAELVDMENIKTSVKQGNHGSVINSLTSPQKMNRNTDSKKGYNNKPAESKNHSRNTRKRSYSNESFGDNLINIEERRKTKRGNIDIDSDIVSSPESVIKNLSHINDGNEAEGKKDNFVDLRKISSHNLINTDSTHRRTRSSARNLNTIESMNISKKESKDNTTKSTENSMDNGISRTINVSSNKYSTKKSSASATNKLTTNNNSEQKTGKVAEESVEMSHKNSTKYPEDTINEIDNKSAGIEHLNNSTKTHDSKQNCSSRVHSLKRQSSNADIEIPVKRLTRSGDLLVDNCHTVDNVSLLNKVKRTSDLITDDSILPRKRLRTMREINITTNDTRPSDCLLDNIDQSKAKIMSEESDIKTTEISSRQIGYPISGILNEKCQNQKSKTVLKNRVSVPVQKLFGNNNQSRDSSVMELRKSKEFVADIDSEHELIDLAPSVTFVNEAKSKNTYKEIDKVNILPINIADIDIHKQSKVKEITLDNVIQTSSKANYDVPTSFIRPQIPSYQKTKHKEGEIEKKRQKSDKQKSVKSKNFIDEEKVKRLQDIFSLKRQELISSQQDKTCHKVTNASLSDNANAKLSEPSHTNDPIICRSKSQRSALKSTIKSNSGKELDKIHKILGKGILQSVTQDSANRSPTLLHPFNSLKPNKSPNKRL